MLTHTNYTVSAELLQDALNTLPDFDSKLAFNEPTGNFFYDPWQLKSEFAGTIWETLYKSLAVQDRGEARIIQLLGGTCYSSHADIDDRYHLNLSGNNCYLIDLDNQNMHTITNDGIWYDMDAGRRHVATNFGNRPRYQLVIRHLLTHNKLTTPADITLKYNNATEPGDARFRFDDILSPWLNRANKQAIIDNFSYANDVVSFQIDKEYVNELQSILPQGFYLA